MSAVVKIPPGKLGAFISSKAREQRKAIGVGLRVAAERARARLVEIMPVDLGHLKNAWRVFRTTSGGFAEMDGYIVENDAPHAGVIESGARPHAVGREGIEAIRAWARRNVHLVVEERGTKRTPKGTSRPLTKREAEGELAWLLDGVVWAIVARIKKEGFKGKHLVRNALPELARMAGEEIDIALDRAVRGGK